MALAHTRMKALSRSGGNTVAMIAYRAGTQLQCERTGLVFDYQKKEVQHVELLLPKDAPAWAVDLQKAMAADRQTGVQSFVNLAESYEHRVDSQVYREYEFALPRELSDAQCRELANEYMQDQMCGRGIAVLANFHFDVNKKTGEKHYHCHAVMLTRYLTEEGLSLKKERAFDKRWFPKVLREQFVAYTNFHLAQYGHTVRIDGRTYAEQGIDLIPQPKLGLGVFKREGTDRDSFKQLREEKGLPQTDRGQAYHQIKLRNLHRICANPALIFKRVTQNQITFMWGNVEKVLSQYIEDPELLKTVSARLKASPELVVLGETANKREKEDTGVYTTRTLLQQEARLMKTLEELGQVQSHGVRQAVQEQALEQLQERMVDKGPLSVDQIEAFYHLLADRQLSCMVGYAGAGKTTLLEGALEAWQQQGYRVYGLAPTGRAAENLQGVGISSQTVHKFLWSYKEGRCQYAKNSVLVLDEAGMVDVERFDALLQAVQALGVKLVMLGDGKQLQPVNAGEAWRFIVQRLQPVTLETVVRQQESWQQEASQLFGQGETAVALSRYLEKGHIHIVPESVRTLSETLTPQESVRQYQQALKVMGFIERDEKASSLHGQRESFTAQRQAFTTHWQDRLSFLSDQVLEKLENYKPYFKAYGIAPYTCAQQLLQHQGLLQDLSPQEKVDKIYTAIKDWKLPRVKGSPVPCEIREASKKALIAAWKESLQAHPHDSQMILAYTNADTADLNRQARAVMQELKRLQGPDFFFKVHKETEDPLLKQTYVTKKMQGFTVGDRLMFLRNKGEIKNGMLGSIESLDKKSITVKLEGREERLTFIPNLYPYFDYGYAATIHKTQGLTVDRTFLLLSREMYANLTYVGFTRHKKDLQVFGSSLEFWDSHSLQKIGQIQYRLSSFDYLSYRQAQTLSKKGQGHLQKSLTRLGDHAFALGAVLQESWKRMVETLTGRTREHALQRVPVALSEQARAQILFDQQYIQPNYGTQRAEEGFASSHAAEVERGDTYLSSSASMDSQDLALKGPSSKTVSISHRPYEDLHYYRSEDVQKALTPSHIASLFQNYIGHWVENPKMMKNGNMLRFGGSGGFVVDGHKGLWYSHYDGQKGNVFHFISETKKCTYKEAVAWVGQWSQAPTTLYQTGYERGQALENSLREQKQAEVDKKLTSQHRAQALWQQSQAIAGTPAERYLRQHRGIQGELPADLRFYPQCRTEGKTFPALLAFTRDEAGQLASYQAIYLDPETAHKALILKAPKKSHGVLKGNAVVIQKDSHKTGITYMAEGLETALSLKEAGLKGEILASLGQSNMGHLKPSRKMIILCGDYDGPNQERTQKNLDKIAQQYQAKGYQVHTLYPTQTGKRKLDFNDLLKEKGINFIRDLIFQEVQDQGLAEKKLPDQRSQTQALTGQELKDKVFTNQDFIKDVTKELPHASPFSQTVDLQKDHTLTPQTKAAGPESRISATPEAQKEEKTGQVNRSVFDSQLTEIQKKALGHAKQLAAFYERVENSQQKIEILQELKRVMALAQTAQEHTIKSLDTSVSSVHQQQAVLQKIDHLNTEIKYETRAPQKQELFKQVDTLITRLDQTHLMILSQKDISSSKETPIVKIERLVGAIEHSTDAQRQQMMTQELSKTYNSLDIKTQEQIKTDSTLYAKLEKTLPQLTQRRGMTIAF